MNKLRLTISGALIYILCSSSVWVDLTLIMPSELMLPSSVHTIAMIDRTLQDDNKQNKIEEIVTGEAFEQDAQAIIRLNDGFIEACSAVNRYEIVPTLKRLKSNGTKSTFPDPLQPEIITDICQQYESDAILSVEIFDTDFIITHVPVNVEVADVNGLKIPRVEIRATGVAVIRLGIRIYAASDHSILDEYQTTYRLNFDAQARTLQEALNKMLDKVDAVNRAGFDAGYNYGRRITPTYYTVRRYFFDKPKKHLGKGVRYSGVADWENAIIEWSEVVNTGKRKAAGRAAYNIAVAYEVLGDLEEAKEWAARSYTEFKEKEADDYFKTLRNRIRDEQLANQQFNKNE